MPIDNRNWVGQWPPRRLRPGLGEPVPGRVGDGAYGLRTAMIQSFVEVEMLHAVFVRTLRPGVTYEQFKDAWMPEHVEGHYLARASVGRNVSNDRQVITILELDVSAEEFVAVAGSLTRPDAPGRLEVIVATTELEGVYEDVFGPASFQAG